MRNVFHIKKPEKNQKTDIKGDSYTGVYTCIRMSILSYFLPVAKDIVPPLTAEQLALRDASEKEKIRMKKINCGTWLERAKLEWKLPTLPPKSYGRYSDRDDQHMYSGRT